MAVMKKLAAFASCAAFAVVSCEDMNGIGSTGSFDPLAVPGGPSAETEVIGGPQRLRPGEFVVAGMDNTAFYNQRPGPEAEADKLLKRGTSMRIISTSDGFHRVELDSGEVGFVPGVMVQPASGPPQPAGQPVDVIDSVTPRPFVPEPAPPPLPEGLPSDFIPDIEPPLETEFDPGTPD